MAHHKHHRGTLMHYPANFYNRKFHEQEFTSIGELARILDMSQRIHPLLRRNRPVNSIKRIGGQANPIPRLISRRLKLIKRLKIMGGAFRNAGTRSHVDL